MTYRDIRLLFTKIAIVTVVISTNTIRKKVWLMVKTTMQKITNRYFCNGTILSQHGKKWRL